MVESSLPGSGNPISPVMFYSGGSIGPSEGVHHPRKFSKNLPRNRITDFGRILGAGLQNTVYVRNECKCAIFWLLTTPGKLLDPPLKLVVGG